MKKHLTEEQIDAAVSGNLAGVACLLEEESRDWTEYTADEAEAIVKHWIASSWGVGLNPLPALRKLGLRVDFERPEDGAPASVEGLDAPYMLEIGKTGRVVISAYQSATD